MPTLRTTLPSLYLSRVAFLEDVLFDEDPLLTASQRDRSRAAGRFNNIVRVSRVDAQQQHEECDIMFRLTGEYVF